MAYIIASDLSLTGIDLQDWSLDLFHPLTSIYHSDLSTGSPDSSTTTSIAHAPERALSGMSVRVRVQRFCILPEMHGKPIGISAWSEGVAEEY